MKPDSETSCLDDETLAAFVSGELEAGALRGIEGHLAGCADCRSVVADAAYGALDAAPPSSVAPPSIPRPGDVLAEKYRIQSLLGRGGMGVVLAAQHIELGHRVAIKLLESSDATAAARFLREARACAQLVNDHIARVFDLGRLPNGVPYFVMEHLTGEDLSRVIARGPVPLAVAIEYMIQTCAALAEAHAAGIIHRDLKPSNLFVSQRSNGKPQIKVLDFGISKFVAGGRLGKSQSLTSPQSILGSPQYMSPEQIRASQTLDARSDIWSLGVVLYELLTGRRPFVGATVSALLVSIATEVPPRPSALTEALPKGVEAVIMRCLEKTPAARFSSVTALVEALERLGSRTKTSTKPAVPGWPWTRGTFVALASLVVIGLCVGAWLVLRSGAGGAIAPDDAVAVVSAELPAQQASPAAAPSPRLGVHCDRPLPHGGIQLATGGTAGLRGLPWQQSLPVAWLCEAETSAQRTRELLSALSDTLALTGAQLEPPHPFYRFEVTHTPEQLDIRLARRAHAPITLELTAPHCGAIGTVRVRSEAQGAPVLATSPAANPASDRSCQRTVELPFEAFGKRLRFQLEPAGYQASPVAFTSTQLAIDVQRSKAPAKPSGAPEKPCLSLYCRD